MMNYKLAYANAIESPNVFLKLDSLEAGRISDGPYDVDWVKQEATKHGVDLKVIGGTDLSVVGFKTRFQGSPAFSVMNQADGICSTFCKMTVLMLWQKVWMIALCRMKTTIFRMIIMS
jgi:hypothetical protein